MTDRIADAFARALAAIDDAMTLVRDLQQQRPRGRIDTLSDSLADPQGHQIEMVLSNSRMAVQSETDRASLILIARACHAQGLIGEASVDRLVRDFEQA